jgi:hypothetical protein
MMQPKPRRERNFREFARSMTQMLVFALMVTPLCSAVIALGIFASRYAPSVGVSTAVPMVLTVPVSFAAMWLALGWSGELAHRWIGSGPPRYRVEVGAYEIVSSGKDKVTETIAWADLNEVALVNEDAWPVGSQYWLLIGKRGGGAVVPSDAAGTGEMLRAMQDRLPDFDDLAVITAMGSTSGSYLVWRRKA